MTDPTPLRIIRVSVGRRASGFVLVAQCLLTAGRPNSHQNWPSSAALVCQASKNRLRATEDDDAVRFTPFHSRAYQVDCLERAGAKRGAW